MHYEVFYIGVKTGWAVAPFDEHGNQIDAADFCFRRCEAIAWAKRINDGKEIWVFTRAGKKTILNQ